MALAMNAALRWLGDFVRGRAGGWTDAGTRLRVFVIAGILFVGGAGFLIDDARTQVPIVPSWHYASDIVCIIGAGGLVFRMKLAYLISYAYTLVFSVLAAAGTISIPIQTVMSWDKQAGSPVNMLLIACVGAALWLVLIVGGIWKYDRVFEWMRALDARIHSPLYGLVMAGAVVAAAWSIVNAITPAIISGWLSAPQVDPYVRLVLLSVVLVLVFAYAMWSYVTLRSRAVRDAFDLP